MIVVTDRRLLDDQIQSTIKQFMQVGATVGHAEHSGDLRRFIEQGKKIIRESGLNVLPADDLDDAAQKIVNAVKKAA